RRSPAKEVMHRVRDGIMNMSRTHSSEQNNSRANQWEPHHAVQIPTQEKRRSLRGRSESDANETARTVLPRQRQVPVEMSSPMQQVSSQIRKKRASRNRQSNNMSVKRAPATLRTGRRPHASKIPTASINPQGSRARGTQKSLGKAVGKTEVSISF
uniref:DEP domain-containing protein n=1 Tax=Parascaris univalens TaxID=6257 RepID=A0A915CH75_PARUN